jgi:hypothetical protein
MAKGIYKRKPCSEETKRKIGNAQLGEKNHMYGKHCSIETKKKMSLASKGKLKSEQARLNMSKGRKGIVFTKEHRKNIGLGGIGLHVGASNGNWKGGPRGEDYLARRNFRSMMQESVFERDDYTCQLCGIRGVDLQVDHIQSWADYVELRFSIDNCRTLCAKCHYKITFGREMPVTVKGWGHNLLRRINP